MKLNLKRRPAALAVLALLSSFTLSAAAQEERKAYIVQLQDQPAATYTGGVTGLAATQPAKGEVFDYRSSKVQNYVSYLGAKKDEVLASVGNPTVVGNYDVVLNGFTVMLTEAEVLALKANPAVAEVQADAVRRLDTVSTTRFLGLSTINGLWSQFSGGSQVKGENLVIGVIDGGIWPENPAFADRVDGNQVPTFDPAGTLAYTAPPATFKGGCVAGEGFDPAQHCNNKLVGAKFYNSGFLATRKPKHWTEYFSPRDSSSGTDGHATGHGGHGDHTASTAAGNANVMATIGGVPMGLTSGMAPRARVAAYKVCWSTAEEGAADGTNVNNGCYNSDSVQAIDDAVKDGVNVINFSIGGSQTSTGDAVEQAFYRASLAGVFVAASAGNAGPANTVAHLSPWLTTVGASTHDRKFQADVKLGNGSTYFGASNNLNSLPDTVLIRAEDAGVGGGNASLCFSAAPPAGQVLLDPAKVAGKVVVCTRGNNARVDKSLAVLNAGGVGMVLSDNGAGLVSEIHSVPTVHVSAADGSAIKAYAVAQAAGAIASLSAFYPGTKPAPVMAGFSSRGPNMGDGNILKPDVTAPGVDIIASYAAPLNPAETAAVAAGAPGQQAYASIQGTSMASPHVAGLGLLLRQAHPDWSPAAIKSALMTTAYDTLDDGLPGAQNGKLAWAQGAGHVAPNKANDPGLVYDMGKAELVAYQCKVNRTLVQPASDCTTYGTLDETYNLNLASITAGAIQNSVTIRRKVTNVGGATATYNASAAVPGFSTVVTPSTLTLAPGATGSFTVKLTRTTAPETVWQFGSLVWSDGNHVVRSPIQARTAKPVIAPALMAGDKADGARLFTVRTTFSGRMTALKGGLKAATFGDSVTLAAQGLSSAALKTACAAGADTANVKVYNVAIPAGAVAARFALFQKDTGNASDDHDLGMLAPDGSWSYSGHDGSAEAVQVASPAAGNYKVCVVAYGGENPAAMQHKLASWIVNPGDSGGQFTAALPGRVYSGVNAIVGVSWAGLDENQSYVGGVQFQDLSGTVQATTLVNVNTGSATVPAADSDRAQAKLQD
ncbi:S8 family serine peptidase [Pseudoduganella sp. S-14]|uniref:S8 family serine peptidase n=1 Tax=Pseudoduganella sp. S-14 TaxID=3404065 RepID=UPI003CF5ACDC